MRFFVEKLRYITLLLVAVLAAACSEEVSVPTTATLSADTVSGQAKNCAVVLTARQGIEYRATITEGDDWCRFSYQRTQDEGVMGEMHNKSLFLSFNENFDITEGRKATIEVSFSDGNNFVLRLTQEWADRTIAFQREWAELPECLTYDDYYYTTHYGKVNGRSGVRNFTLCFDRTKRAALWVAYPLHSLYTVGPATRQDDFIADPTIPSQYQASLFKSYAGRYDRGHQIPAADRKCTQDMMDQTFYWSNMTPQQSDFNQKLWASLENSVRGEICTDTLYVVTGCHFDGERNSSIQASTTASGVSCPIPTHYYKLLLRTESGRTGKSISEITSAGDLRAVAIYIPHHNSGESTTLNSEWFMSVNELERITGFDFFTMLPDAIEEQVEEQCNRSKWF